MERIARIGVSLPENLLRRFDSILDRRGYSSRSEGIRDAIRNYITEFEWLEQEKGERVGVVTVVYDHSVKGITDSILDIQHSNSDVISGTMHMHMGRNCLEVILVKGEVDRIKDIAEKLISIRGVKNVKLVTTVGEEHI